MSAERLTSAAVWLPKLGFSMAQAPVVRGSIVTLKPRMMASLAVVDRQPCV